MWQQLLPDFPAAAPKVARIAAWEGWCSPCGDERPLVLTETGPRGPLAWLQGVRPDDRALLLTCRLCGVGQPVPRHEADDPEPADAVPADAVPGGAPTAHGLTPAEPAADDRTTTVHALVACTAADLAATGHPGADHHGPGQGQDQALDGDLDLQGWAGHDPGVASWADRDDEDDHLVPGMRAPDEEDRPWSTPGPDREPAPAAVPGRRPAPAAAWSDPVDDELARLLPGLVRTTPSARPAAADPAPVAPAPASGAAAAVPVPAPTVPVPGLAAALPLPRVAEPPADQDDEAVLQLLGEGLDLLAP